MSTKQGREITVTDGKWSVIDLFSGCGGMSYGFWKYRRFFRLIGAVDLEKGKPGLGKSPGTSVHCNGTYERNLGLAPKRADLAELVPQRYREELGLRPGELTVLISCAPCTGFSQKKALNHTVDEPQNVLVERSADFVAEFMPEFFVMENVKELVRGRLTYHFDNLSCRLDELGYSLDAQVYDFSEYGLPQRRLRALIVARRDRGPVHGLVRKRPGATVRQTIGHLPPLSQGQCHRDDPMHVCPKHGPAVTERMRAIPKDGGSWGDIVKSNPHLLIPSMKRKRRPGSWWDVYGRLWWDRPAVTITRECGHPGNGRFTHPEQDRHLSVREMALLQGFPSDYCFEGPLIAKYNQIGDAVPPPIAEQVAEVIVDLMSPNRRS